MAKSDFLPFGISEGANVLSNQEYESLVARHNGFTSGVAKSKELNKVWRQSSVFTAILAQFIVDTDGEDLPDDGNLPAVKVRLVSALKEAFRGEMPAVPKTVQTTGESTKDVMSQKAVTDAINNIKIPEVSDATNGRKGVVQLDDTISDSDTKVPPSKLIKAALADKPSTASMTLELNKKVNKSDVSDQLGNDKSKVPSLDLLTTELGKKAAAGSSYSKAESDNKYQPKGNYALKSDLDAYQKKTLLVSGIKQIYNGTALNKGSSFTVNEDLRGRMLYLQNSMDRGFTPIVIPQDNMTISSVVTSDSWYEIRLTNNGRTFNVASRNGGVMATMVFVSV
ncbi:TPA: hypothetical protein I8608_000997 [Morganella morganii]|uniref:Tail fiber protein n=1 Tax=Morganella morganii TaxID=582 RepID=A0AAN5MDA5_MORMO|nr:hypothetical protein [Morganella morganii]